MINKTVYLTVELIVKGKKEMFGMSFSKSESLVLWISVSTDLRTRGLEDIQITAIDNLKGFTKTLRAIFPESQTQIFVVNQIRNAFGYVIWKDEK